MRRPPPRGQAYQADPGSGEVVDSRQLAHLTIHLHEADHVSRALSHAVHGGILVYTYNAVVKDGCVQMYVAVRQIIEENGEMALTRGPLQELVPVLRR